MRKLDGIFIKKFHKNGLYRPIIDTVIHDSSLDFQIRDGYINLYFMGNSILNLNENGQVEINNKFLKGSKFNSKSFLKNEDVNNFLLNIPIIKNNVIKVKSKKPTLEIEYEQLMIRSNNLNKNVNSEIFITDRQYTDNDNNARFDLSGFLCKNRTPKNKSVPLTFIEVKYSLNPDITNIDKQISKYYNSVKNKIDDIAEETQYLKNLKIDLGLINKPKERLDVLKTLKVSNKIEDVQFIIGLIDYNPNSKKFNTKILKALPFKNQIKIFKGGFGIWEKNLKYEL